LSSDSKIPKEILEEIFFWEYEDSEVAKPSAHQTQGTSIRNSIQQLPERVALALVT